MRDSKGRFIKGSTPWIKGRKVSDEVKEKTKKTWFKKGDIPWIKGRKHTKKTRDKLRRRTLEQFKNGFPEDIKKKQSKTLKRMYKEGKLKTFEKGCMPWNKGKTNIYSEETLRKLSEANSGEKHRDWVGGKEGYHRRIGRKIMEQNLNRKLKNKEAVHHLDFDWKNNSIDNLHLFINGSQHIKYHMMLRRFVKEGLEI